MRGLGVPIVVLAAGCKFGGPPLAGDAGSGDAMIDARRPDGAPGAARKKRITIDPAKVTGRHDDFPVWIALTDLDLAAHAAADGSDIYFTRPDGSPLEHQLQRWTKSAGRLEGWVRIDLEDDTPTLLDLRYGDPGPAHGPNPPLVFSSSFAAVWHLDDPLETPAVADARNARNGTAMGGLGAADQIAAQLGGGIDFDGVNNQIQFVNPFAGNAEHTFSAWIFQRMPLGCDSIVTVGTPANNRSRFLHSNYVTSIGAGFFVNDRTPAIVLAPPAWTLLHWVFEGNNRKSRLYRNGVEVDNGNYSPGIDTQGAAGYLGYAPSGWSTCALNGTLDEVRLATTSRNAGWIATEYANQQAPATFYSVGAEEIVP